MENRNEKLEILKQKIQMWQHADRVFWDRFQGFITLVTISAALMAALFTIWYGESNADEKWRLALALFLLASSFGAVGLGWLSMLQRGRTYMFHHEKKISDLQKDLCIKIICNSKKEDPGFRWLAKVPSIRVVYFFVGLYIFACIVLTLFFLIFLITGKLVFEWLKELF